jgi:hypothetical protein
MLEQRGAVVSSHQRELAQWKQFAEELIYMRAKGEQIQCGHLLPGE